jgi:hypothetical protein
MPSAGALELVLGADQDYPLQITTDGQTPSTAYLGTDVLAARVWPGGSQAAVATPACSWADATTASFVVSFRHADTAGLEAGTYRLQVTASRGGLSPVVYDGTVRLLAAPGATPAAATYDQIADVRKVLAKLEDLQDDANQEGFADARAQTREFIDETILARYEDVLRDQARRHTAVLQSDPIVPTTGMDAGPTWGPSGIPDTTIRDQVDALRSALAANQLIVDSRLRRTAALFTAAAVLEQQIGKASDGTPFQRHAERLRARATRSLYGWVARIDTYADDVADVEIR